MSKLSDDQINRIIDLYKRMPGAEMPSREDGRYMWGDVYGTDHWEFCQRIVEMVDKEIGHAINRLSSDHGLI